MSYFFFLSFFFPGSGHTSPDKLLVWIRVDLADKTLSEQNACPKPHTLSLRNHQGEGS